MADIKRAEPKGLIGKDRQQKGLRDDRAGTYDVVGEAGKSDMPADPRRAPGERETASLPEGLKRKRKGPVGPKSGRGAGNK